MTPEIGQMVKVALMHGMTADGFGVFLGVSKEHGFEGYYKIENEYGLVMRIEPNRVTWKGKTE